MKFFSVPTAAWSAGFAAGALLLACAAFSSPASASPLTFLITICTVDSPALEQQVDDLGRKLQRARRFAGAGSRYRRHLEGHAAETMEALAAVQKRDDCSAERKLVAARLLANLRSVTERSRPE
jgi:hypothetical protein